MQYKFNERLLAVTKTERPGAFTDVTTVPAALPAAAPAASVASVTARPQVRAEHSMHCVSARLLRQHIVWPTKQCTTKHRAPTLLMHLCAVQGAGDNVLRPLSVHGPPSLAGASPQSSLIAYSSKAAIPADLTRRLSQRLVHWDSVRRGRVSSVRESPHIVNVDGTGAASRGASPARAPHSPSGALQVRARTGASASGPRGRPQQRTPHDARAASPLASRPFNGRGAAAPVLSEAPRAGDANTVAARAPRSGAYLQGDAAAPGSAESRNAESREARDHVSASSAELDAESGARTRVLAPHGVTATRCVSTRTTRTSTEGHNCCVQGSASSRSLYGGLSAATCRRRRSRCHGPAAARGPVKHRHVKPAKVHRHECTVPQYCARAGGCIVQGTAASLATAAPKRVANRQDPSV